MIAKNYIRYPEALRFQVEMFSNGYKNSPRIMRLMTVIFKQIADVPAWVKEAAAAAKRLVKMWKAAQIVLNFAEPFNAMKEAKKATGEGLGRIHGLHNRRNMDRTRPGTNRGPEFP